MPFRELIGNYKKGDSAATHVSQAGALLVDTDNQSVYVQNGSSPGTLLNSVFQSVTVPLSVEQLNNLQTNPVPLFAAPGAGKIYVIHSVLYNFNFVTTPYSGDGIQIWYGSSISADTGDAGVFTGGASQLQQALPWSAINGQNLPTSLCANAAMFIWSPNSNLTGGDGTGSVTVFYSLINVV